MALIEVVYAHPYPSRSRACASLLSGIADMAEVRIRSLYDLYPDFDIDGEAERAALSGAGLVVWLHPLYWYSPPALMHRWLEVVLVQGFAWGEGGDALRGKDCLWVTTTASEGAFSGQGPCGPATELTARACGMNWLEPIALAGGRFAAPGDRGEATLALRSRLQAWLRERAAS